jgi:hypothetical protein
VLLGQLDEKLLFGEEPGCENKLFMVRVFHLVNASLLVVIDLPALSADQVLVRLHLRELQLL